MSEISNKNTIAQNIITTIFLDTKPKWLFELRAYYANLYEYLNNEVETLEGEYVGLEQKQANWLAVKGYAQGEYIDSLLSDVENDIRATKLKLKLERDKANLANEMLILVNNIIDGNTYKSYIATAKANSLKIKYKNEGKTYLKEYRKLSTQYKDQKFLYQYMGEYINNIDEFLTKFIPKIKEDINTINSHTMA